MLNRLTAILAAVVLFMYTGSAFAAFADLELIRVYYDRNGAEIATDLGKVKDLLAASNSTLPGSFGALSTGFAAYFALDRNTNQLWATGSTTTPSIIVGTSNGLTGMKSGTTNVYGWYNLKGNGSTYTGLASDTNSYKNRLSGTQGNLASAIAATSRLSTEVNLSSLIGATSGSVTQTLYFWNNALATDTAGKTGVAVATITTNFDGSTIIGPPPAVNGTCGNANGTAVTNPPTTNLCSSGAASTVTGSGPWNWTCDGQNGGTSATCSAPVLQATATPTITWPTPGAINYGTALSSTQLNATASDPATSATVAGTFTYSQTSGSILNAGTQSLSVTFTPNDTTAYTTATASINLSVNPASLTITAANASRTYGTANPAVTGFSPSGLVGSDSISSVTNTIAATATPTAAAGSTHAITPSAAVFGSGTAANYAINYVNGTLTITPSTATVVLGNLSQTYDGNAKTATATTTPAGLATTITYNGSATAPTAAGTYAVVANISDANYTGSTTGTLAIAKATATVALGGLSQTYDGSVKPASATTTPASLSTTITYDGSATAPTAAGNYTVVATINDANYTGSATGTMTISKATATVALGGLSQTYNGTAWSATATTTPTGLSTTFSYNGSATAPTLAGSYTVIATVNDTNYTGSTSGTLVIAKATPSITWATPAAVPPGTALGSSQLNATAANNLPGTWTYTPAAGTVMNTSGQTLSVLFTPTDTVNYTTATASVTLTVNAKLNPTVTWPAPAAITYSTALSDTQLNASAGGIAGSFSYSPAATTVLNAGNQTLTATFTPSDTNTYNIATATVPLMVNKAIATVTLGGLSQPYNGTARSASVTTNPSGLSTTITYDGSATAPSAAGTYTVVATINDANYSGSATGSMSISNSAATVTLDGLSQTYDGSAKPATATTVPAGLSTTITYNGSATAPTAAGNYTVVATINDANHSGSVTGTLTIAKATATASLVNLSQTYDGSTKSVSAVTTPAGLSTAITYNGSTTAPAATGTYSVVATINDANYTGSISGTLTINKATATVVLNNLSQPFDGSAKSVTATTTPVGLTTTITYNGSTTAPTAAGTYTVVATINDANYSGSATGSLTIGKGAATITWAAPAAITYGTPLSATQLNAATSGVPGTYTYTPASGSILNAGTQNLSVTFTPADSTKYASVTSNVSLTVNKATPTVTWKTPAAIDINTPLSATQLNATASMAGSFAYSPAADTLLPAGSQKLSVTFTPADSVNYSTATASVNLQVNPWYPGGALNGSKTPTVADALKVLQASVGLITLTPLEQKNVDVAPLVNGKPQPNGKIDLGDVLVILERAVGSIPAW